MDVTYFASYREDACGVASRAIIKEQGIFTCRSFGIWPAMPHRLVQIVGPMSALPPKADKQQMARFVRLVPKADSCTAIKRIAIRSPRRRACWFAAFDFDLAGGEIKRSG